MDADDVEKIRSYLMEKGMSKAEFERFIRDADERIMEQMSYAFPDFCKND